MLKEVMLGDMPSLAAHSSAATAWSSASGSGILIPLIRDDLYKRKNPNPMPSQSEAESWALARNQSCN